MSEDKSKKLSPNASVRTKRTPAPLAGAGSQVRSKGPAAAPRSQVSSGSRRAAPMQVADKIPVPGIIAPRVFDNGIDVTPLPLLTDSRQKMGDLPAGATPDMASISSAIPGGTITASTFGGAPFTRSVLSMSQSGRSSVSYDELDAFSDTLTAPTWTEMKLKRDELKEVLTDSDLEKLITINLSETETIWMLDITGICVADASDEAPAIVEQNERYQERHRIQKLNEEYAQYHLDDDVESDLEEELVKTRVGNDLYVERGMNTFNEQPKQKSVQTNRITSSDEGVQASNWDMYDTYKEIADAGAAAKAAEEEEGMTPISDAPVPGEPGVSLDDAPTGAAATGKRPASASQNESRTQDRIGSALAKESESRSTFTSSSAAGTESVYAVTAFNDTNKEEIMQARNDAILKSDSLKTHCALMERALSLNKHQQRTACYRQLPVLPAIHFEDEAAAGDAVDEAGDGDEEETEDGQPQRVAKQPSSHDKFSSKSRIIDILETGPKLDRLWSYTCALTKGHNVSCLAWNKTNPDILAVGYGQFEFNKQKGGLCCCWSLKNVEYPERVYKFDVGVTSIDFSQNHPNHLAVGLYDGTIAIFNVRNPTDEPVLTNRSDIHVDRDESEVAGKHAGPVWQLRWVEKERGAGEMKAEVLVSTSTDGRVTQWSIRKGFESYDLMKLKRTQVKSGTGRVKKADALISKNAGGLCFSFNPRDSNVYLVGTEEGFVHKCSCSYNEQYLDTYTSHTGPVYRAHWSPFSPDIFLSCSGDYTVKLWHQDKLTPVVSCQSSFKIVHDISWSPRSSTIFACVNEGGVEVWDLSQSVIDPILQDRGTENANLTAVTFAPNSECVLYGDADGAVTVLQIVNLPKPASNQAGMLSALVESTLSSSQDEAK